MDPKSSSEIIDETSMMKDTSKEELSLLETPKTKKTKKSKVDGSYLNDTSQDSTTPKRNLIEESFLFDESLLVKMTPFRPQKRKREAENYSRKVTKKDSHNYGKIANMVKTTGLFLNKLQRENIQDKKVIKELEKDLNRKSGEIRKVRDKKNHIDKERRKLKCKVVDVKNESSLIVSKMQNKIRDLKTQIDEIEVKYKEEAKRENKRIMIELNKRQIVKSEQLAQKERQLEKTKTDFCKVLSNLAAQITSTGEAVAFKDVQLKSLEKDKLRLSVKKDKLEIQRGKTSELQNDDKKKDYVKNLFAEFEQTEGKNVEKNISKIMQSAFKLIAEKFNIPKNEENFENVLNFKNMFSKIISAIETKNLANESLFPKNEILDELSKAKKTIEKRDQLLRDSRKEAINIKNKFEEEKQKQKIELKNITKKLNEKSLQTAKLQEEVGLNKRLKISNTEFATAKAETARMKTTEKANLQKIESLKSENKLLSLELKEQKELYKKTAFSDRAEISDNSKKFKLEILKLKEQNKLMERKILNLKGESSKRIAELENQLEKSEKLKYEVKLKGDSFSTALKQEKETVKTLKEQLTNEINDKNEFEVQLKTSENNLSEVESSKKTIENYYISLKQKYRELKEHYLSDIAKKKTTEKQTIQTIKKEISAKEETISNLKIELHKQKVEKECEINLSKKRLEDILQYEKKIAELQTKLEMKENYLGLRKFAEEKFDECSRNKEKDSKFKLSRDLRETFSR